MIYLSDDDLIAPTYIESITRHIQRVPNASLVRSRHRLIDDNGNFLRLDQPSPVQSTPCEFMAQIYLPDHKSFRTNISAVAFRKSLLLQVGGVKTLGKVWHIDRLAWAEMGSTGDVICEPEPLVSIRLHTASITSSLDPDYGLAIATTELTREYVSKVFERLRGEARTPEQHELLDRGELEFRGYINRHLQRAVDHGMLAALQKNDSSVNREVNKIVDAMKRLSIPPFPSLPFYRFSAKLPEWLRPIVVAQLRQAKLARRTRN
jgi:hypothetical protein